MNCRWCIRPSSMVIVEPTTTREVILSITFDHYSCAGNGTMKHKPYVCKKCGRSLWNVNSSLTHGIWCNNNTRELIYENAVPLGIVGGKHVYLDTSELFREMPYCCLLRIDYENAARKVIMNLDNKIPLLNSVIADREDIKTIIDLIKKSPPSCPFCGRYYETFPTEDIVIEHCKKCKI